MFSALYPGLPYIRIPVIYADEGNIQMIFRWSGLTGPAPVTSAGIPLRKRMRWNEDLSRINYKWNKSNRILLLRKNPVYLEKPLIMRKKLNVV